MKLIAHRGASLEYQENSIESLKYAAQIGAYAVECDIRQTKDRQYIIFHDDNLKRITGIDLSVSDITLLEMQHHLKAFGYGLVTFSDLVRDYKENTPVLLHIKLSSVTLDFVHMLKESGIDFICGIHQADMAKMFSKVFPKNRILAFMPQKEDYTVLANNGAGIIRLWEQWLPGMDLDQIRKEISNVEIWIMACDNNGSMNGSGESLNYFQKIGADGVLLNDITLGIEWSKNY